MRCRAVRLPLAALAATLLAALPALPAAGAPAAHAAAPPARAAGPTSAASAAASTEASTSAGAATRPDDAAVTVSSVTPQVARHGHGVTITGTVQARRTLTDPHLRVWLRRTVTARVQLTDALHATVPQGSLRSDVPLAPTLAAGGSARFKVVLPAADLQGGGDVAVRLVGLQVRATGADGPTQVALRTLPVPWVPATAVPHATRLAVVVPMTAAPRRTATDVFVDNSLAAAVAPGGRLRLLLAAATGWTLAIDPSLVEDLAVMAQPSGYEIASSTAAAPLHLPASADARGLLHALAQRARTPGAVTLLPYADPAVDALVRAGADGDIGRAARTAQARAAALLGANLQVEALLPAAPADEVRTATATAWLRQVATPVVLPESQVPGTDLAPATPDAAVALSWPGGARTPGVVLDTTVSTELAQGGTDASGSLQQFLGETAMHTAELPGRPRGLLAVLPRDWNPSAGDVAALRHAFAAAAWVQRTTFSALVADAEQGTARTVIPAEARGGGAALPLSVQRVRRHVAAGHAFAQVLAVPKAGRQLAAAYDREGLRLESLDASDAAALLHQSTGELQAREDSIRLVVNRLITLPASRSFPLTVRNSGKDTVRVGVAFSRSPRVQVQGTPVMTIEPDHAVRVEVATSPGANGRALITAYLVSPTGGQVGAPATLRLSIRGAGAPARLVVSVAAAVFILALAVRLFRRRRAGPRGSVSGSGAGPDQQASQSQEVPA